MENYKPFSFLGILSINVLKIKHPTAAGPAECLAGQQKSGKAIAFTMEIQFV